MATLVLNSGTPEERSARLDKPAVLIGSSPDADICLESASVSDRHARIERKSDGYYLISLSGESCVLVNEDEVTFQKLSHGDLIEIGDVTGRLVLDMDDAPDHQESVQPAAPAGMMMPVSTAGMAAPALRQGAPSACPRCGMPVQPGQMACMHCGFQFSNLPAMPMDFVPPVAGGQVGAGILPIIAFLAALTVVGAPVALVLGLMSLSIIRRRGGTVRDRALSKWSVGLGFVWIVLGSVLITRSVLKDQQMIRMEKALANEAQVIEALKNLACVHKYARTIEYDNGSNLSALSKISSQFFDAELADGEAYGYRFIIREASRERFLAVAEPLRYGESGLRSFAIDEGGLLRGVDAKGERLSKGVAGLPVLQDVESAYYKKDEAMANDVWRYIESLPGNPDSVVREKILRIIDRLRNEYPRTQVVLQLKGQMEATSRDMVELQAQTVYLEAHQALTEGKQEVALSKFSEIMSAYPGFTKIADVEKELDQLRARIAERKEQDALALFEQAEALERQGGQQDEVRRLYQQIEKRYPETAVAVRIASLTPELQRQLREGNAEDLFSELMELSPETEFEKILSQIDQLRRNYSDTGLFAKVQDDLGEKERKARASSWRDKTQQNMAEGHMRGALAQLESAARENPDLLYDLRDLCTELYQTVAGTLMEEGDARAALTYYQRANRLLQAAGSGAQVDPKVLAELHNSVGQSDFERKNYDEARLHLSSAAWNYQDDAQFNMRLGAASLYSGLYRPAEKALAQALSVRSGMEPALLYRTYMNLRVVFAQERVVAGLFVSDGSESSPAASDESGSTESSTPSAFQISVNNSEDSEGDGVTFTTQSSDAGVVSVAAPEALDVSYGSAGGDWFSQFAGGGPGAGSVPNPTDVDLFVDFDYAGSIDILPAVMGFVEELQMENDERKVAMKQSAIGGFGSGSRIDARQAARYQERMDEQRNTAIFKEQLRELRTIHISDASARKELCLMLDEMKARIQNGLADMEMAGEQQPQIRSLTEHVRAQVAEKYELLTQAEALIVIWAQDEVALREEMLELAAKMVEDVDYSSGRKVERFQKRLYDEDRVAIIEQALRALRDSMDVDVDIKNILSAAEGDVQAAANAL